jgi:hypothetical protein
MEVHEERLHHTNTTLQPHGSITMGSLHSINLQEAENLKKDLYLSKQWD